MGDSAASKSATSKDSYRPRHYDISILNIGYFKVEDAVDSRGRFRSKFKVLYSKRQFIYDFPVIKCNQVDVGNTDAWHHMVRVLVPFKIVEAVDMRNRRINIKVSSCPQIYLWEMQRKSGLTMANSKGFTEPSENSMWFDVVQNSLLHKITLRKRQADNLKIQLCEFDPLFLPLFSMGLQLGTSVIDATPFEEELASSNLRKLYQKNKNNFIRRLPQWDFDPLSESPLPNAEEDLLLSEKQVCCSCRVSCSSLRCSCVKVPKSCNTGGTKCLCMSCDNPLNILESFELCLDFCLNDCCLFQNIYQIRNLRNFLLRDVKLACCNTVARVLDCIPGTILCPNTECNASLEFSWCRAIVCYPERNPRNHCSYCGQCCFSNGRHCPVCNRCYVVTPKCPECPNCIGNGLTPQNPVGQDFSFDNSFYSTLLPPAEDVTMKPCSKPEIILLDSAKSERQSSKKEEIRNIEMQLLEDTVATFDQNSPTSVKPEDLENLQCSLKSQVIDVKETEVNGQAEVKPEYLETPIRISKSWIFDTKEMKGSELAGMKSDDSGTVMDLRSRISSTKATEAAEVNPEDLKAPMRNHVSEISNMEVTEAKESKIKKSEETLIFNFEMTDMEMPKIKEETEVKSEDIKTSPRNPKLEILNSEIMEVTEVKEEIEGKESKETLIFSSELKMIDMEASKIKVETRVKPEDLKNPICNPKLEISNMEIMEVTEVKEE